MTHLHAGHEFTYENNELRWKLTGQEKYREQDFLRFMEKIVTLFGLHGRLLVVLSDGRIKEISGFNGIDTDYERIYVSMRVWI